MCTIISAMPQAVCSCRRVWKIEYFRNFTVKTDKPGAYVLELFSCVGYLQASSDISLLYSLFSFT